MTTTTRLLPDVPEEDYHADPALSSSGARRLIRVTPKHFQWEREHPGPPTDAMVLGSAVHSLILGVGPAAVEIGYDSWRTNAAKDDAAEHRAAGRIPLLTKDYRRAVAMADAVRLHHLAGPILDAAEHREVSGWWVDDESGVDCRVRFDAVGVLAGVPVVVDVKTSAGLISDFPKSVDRFGYDQQHPWYCEAAAALGLADGWPDFLFVVQETEPPYLTAVRRLDGEWVERGHLRNRRARDVFAQCSASGVWPAYPLEIETVPMSRWASAS